MTAERGTKGYEYSLKEREGALEMLMTFGIAETHKRTAITKATLLRWSKAAGLTVPWRHEETVERSRKAAEESRVSREERKERIALAALILAEHCLERASAPMTTFKAVAGSRVPVEIRLDEPEPQDVRALVASSHQLLQMSNLAAGEATERIDAGPDELRMRVLELSNKLATMRDPIAIDAVAREIA